MHFKRPTLPLKSRNNLFLGAILTRADFCRTADALEALHTKLPSLEVLSSHATAGYTLWALGLFASVYGADAPGVDSATGLQRHPLWTVHELDLSGRGLESLKPEVSPDAGLAFEKCAVVRWRLQMGRVHSQKRAT
jgi:hypothetical protein